MLPPQISMFSRDRREFDNFVLTTVHHHSSSIITNSSISSTMYLWTLVKFKLIVNVYVINRVIWCDVVALLLSGEWVFILTLKPEYNAFIIMLLFKPWIDRVCRDSAAIFSLFCRDIISVKWCIYGMQLKCNEMPIEIYQKWLTVDHMVVSQKLITLSLRAL